MNVLDIIIIVILLGAIMRGYRIGFIRQIVHLFGYFVAFFIAYRFSNEIVPWIKNVVPAPTFQQSSMRMFSETFQLQTMFYHAIAFFILFMLVNIVLQIGGGILHQVASLPGLAIVNQTLGATIGFIQTFLILIILLNIVSVMPSPNIIRWIDGSLFAHYFYDWTPMITKELYKLWSTSAVSL
ncbi:CvpA family protein [Tepidibacillus marianensis]|uniref:CvpA family protein n=1 Tax=Tepidibacillus marianensis TaxID=3131995 RepID=UPI0030CDABBA